MRIDKFLWHVRLYKTRSIATKAANNDRVMIGGEIVKPGKTVSIGDEIAIKVNPIWRTFTILDLTKSQLGAKLVAGFITETTPKEDLDTLASILAENRELRRYTGFKGRPTKKVRRDQDRFRQDD